MDKIYSWMSRLSKPRYFRCVLCRGPKVLTWKNVNQHFRTVHPERSAQGDLEVRKKCPECDKLILARHLQNHINYTHSKIAFRLELYMRFKETS